MGLGREVNLEGSCRIHRIGTLERWAPQERSGTSGTSRGEPLWRLNFPWACRPPGHPEERSCQRSENASCGVKSKQQGNTISILFISSCICLKKLRLVTEEISGHCLLADKFRACM